MLKSIIKKYTKNMTKNDIITFSKKQNTKLKKYEVDIIYDQLKNNIDNILIDVDKELFKIKDKLEYTTYLKIKELISFYKNKYKNYL